MHTNMVKYNHKKLYECAEQPISDHTFGRFRERLFVYEGETGLHLLK